MPLGELLDPSRGYLVNDTRVVDVEVAICKAMDSFVYDSKKEIGFVGLKNQGATCYMNYLLQTLYHIPLIRKVVYHMPTSVDDLPSASIPLAMQRLFYKLQYIDNSVATKNLTNPLDGTHMMLSCNMMYKNSIEYFAKSSKRKRRS